MEGLQTVLNWLVYWWLAWTTQRVQKHDTSDRRDRHWTVWKHQTTCTQSDLLYSTLNNKTVALMVVTIFSPPSNSKIVFIHGISGVQHLTVSSLKFSAADIKSKVRMAVRQLLYCNFHDTWCCPWPVTCASLAILFFVWRWHIHRLWCILCMGFMRLKLSP